MKTDLFTPTEFDKPAIPGIAVLLGLLGIALGSALAAFVLPAWLPNLSASIVGTEPKAFWYLSRSSAMVAFWLLWFSMAWGVLITNKLARIWPGGPTAFDLHQYASILGLGFGIFHALILLGDRCINYTVAQIVLPFGSYGYRLFWVGLGQLATYLWALLLGSFYIRRQIGQRSWRLIHYAGFLAFVLALVHGIASGTDSQSLGAAIQYWFSAGSLLFLSMYRVLLARSHTAVKKRA